MNETPKKLSHRAECCFLCKNVLPDQHEKIRVFGKSSIDIPNLIFRATNVDLSLYVGCENLSICRMKCYKILTRYKNALQKVDEIKHEITREFTGNMLVPVSVKRMAKDVEEPTFQTNKRSLAFEDPRVISTTETAPASVSIKVQRPTEYGPISSIAVHGSVEGCETAARRMPVMSTPTNRAKTFSLPDFKQTETESAKRETKVSLTVHYPSKTIQKELTDDFASLGKAIAHGSSQRIARAVLKNDTLKKYVLEKVLKLLTLQVSGLCSRRKPSILRSKTKDELAGFEFKKLCLGWKERAPLFYAFLMTVVSVKKDSNLQWLPSISVAGSILLKQRNSHMNGCATILGLLIKSGSIEVSLLCIIFYVIL